jgi:small subunit ribosomal protein S13
MVRVVGVDLPRAKRMEYALTYIYGIGLTTSQEILKKADIDFNTKSDDLTEAEVLKLRDIIRELKVEGDLRREVSLNIKRLMEIGCYRGTRHKKKLPARGQRTKTNARTRRGGIKRTVSRKK